MVESLSSSSIVDVTKNLESLKHRDSSLQCFEDVELLMVSVLAPWVRGFRV